MVDVEVFEKAVASIVEMLNDEMRWRGGALELTCGFGMALKHAIHWCRSGLAT